MTRAGEKLYRDPDPPRRRRFIGSWEFVTGAIVTLAMVALAFSFVA